MYATICLKANRLKHLFCVWSASNLAACLVAWSILIFKTFMAKLSVLHISSASFVTLQRYIIACVYMLFNSFTSSHCLCLHNEHVMQNQRFVKVSQRKQTSSCWLTPSVCANSSDACHAQIGCNYNGTDTQGEAYLWLAVCPLVQMCLSYVLQNVMFVSQHTQVLHQARDWRRVCKADQTIWCWWYQLWSGEPELICR